MMIEDIKKDASERMNKSVVALGHTMAKIRAGRAHVSLLDHVMVPYYGADVPLSQVANVGVEDSRTLTVTPWEKPMLSVIEKAIMTSDLGVNPNSAGMTIRIPIPPLTEERRKDLVKVARSEAENTRVAIRNIRRDANSTLKDLLKEKEISEDEERGAEEEIQKITDSVIKQVEQVLSEKETDLMEV
jgi:ribosome recycling factor